MFNIFSKKYTLPDLIEDGLDIHSHILPAIDDGAKDIDNALFLIQGLKDLGITKSYATPHIMDGFFDNDNKIILDTYHSFTKHLESIGYNHEIYPSAEYMLDDQFYELLKAKDLILKKHDFLLVEMSYAYETPQFEQILFEIQSNGINPIMAHPERYNYWSSDYDIEKLKDRGIHFQLNALALSEYYGSAIQRKALKWLEEGMYTFIGTDLHHKRHLDALKNLKISKKHAGLVRQLWENNKAYLS